MVVGKRASKNDRVGHTSELIKKHSAWIPERVVHTLGITECGTHRPIQGPARIPEETVRRLGIMGTWDLWLYILWL